MDGSLPQPATPSTALANNMMSVLKVWQKSCNLANISGVFSKDLHVYMCSSFWVSGAILYKKLKKYMMTEEQLEEHSYPRPHPEIPGHAVVHNYPEKKNNDREFVHCQCCLTNRHTTRWQYAQIL